MINAIAIDDEPIALKVIEALCRKTEKIVLNKMFTEPNEALKHLRKFPTDLIFVDIQMPSITGIDLVKELQNSCMVIFTTAYSEYAAVSYELNAIDYLLKPISFNRFELAINKAIDYYNFIQKKETLVEQFIFVRADFSLVKIVLNDILYVEGLADYLKIYIKNSKTVVTRMTMKEMVEKLPKDKFIRIHRSFIIPIANIVSVRNGVVFTNEKEFPIGRTYLEEFKLNFKAS